MTLKSFITLAATGGCRRRRPRRRLRSGHGQRRHPERARQLPQDAKLRSGVDGLKRFLRR